MTESPVRARTLEYTNAMKHFKFMFPTLDPEVIECVLRSNSGHVDSTIDNLLQLTIDDNGKHTRNIHRDFGYGREPVSEWDDRQRSEACCPPKYTALAAPHHSRMYSSNNVPPPHRSVRYGSEQSTQSTFRDWNPPLLGKLPDDFLRIVPSSPPVSANATSHNVPHSSRTSHSRNSSMHQNDDDPRKKNVYRQNSSPNLTPRSLSRRSSDFQSSEKHNVNGRNRVDRQTIEDRKIALLLQNKEFMLELRRNKEFLKELQQYDSDESNTEPKPHQFHPITVDPFVEIKDTEKEPEPLEDLEHSSFNGFQDRGRPTNKSTKRKLSDIAQRLNLRRTSYKSMSKIDPIFANTDDNDVVK